MLPGRSRARCAAPRRAAATRARAAVSRARRAAVRLGGGRGAGGDGDPVGPHGAQRAQVEAAADHRRPPGPVSRARRFRPLVRQHQVVVGQLELPGPPGGQRLRRPELELVAAARLAVTAHIACQRSRRRRSAGRPRPARRPPRSRRPAAARRRRPRSRSCPWRRIRTTVTRGGRARRSATGRGRRAPGHWAARRERPR